MLWFAFSLSYPSPLLGRPAAGRLAAANQESIDYGHDPGQGRADGLVRIGAQVDLADEGRPAVLELMCDECEEMVDLQDVDAELRKEIFLILGAG